MALALRTTEDAEAAHEPTKPPEARSDDAADYDDGLLAVAGPIMGLCYGILFAIAAFTFSGAGSALFAVVISTFFGVIYFAIPMVFLRIRNSRDKRWSNDTAQSRSPEVDVWTGRMRRSEAIIQIVSIPATIVVAFAFLAIRWSFL